MNILLKKSIALMVCIFFVLTSMTAISESIVDEKNITIIEKVTLLRYGPDGSVEPVIVEIELKEDQDIDNVIAEKCNELLSLDQEIQDLLNNQTGVNRTSGVFKVVSSKGKGLHFKLKTRLRLTLNKKLTSLKLPRISVIPRKPLIYCNYVNDPNAYTEVSPMFKSDPNATKIVTGNHSVLALNFIGYTSWSGRFSFTPFDILPRSFSGIALFIICKSPKNMVSE